MIATSRSGWSLIAASHLASATLTKASQSVARDLFVFIPNVSMVFVRCLASPPVLLGLTQYHLVSDFMARLVCKLLILKIILIKFAVPLLSEGLETFLGQAI